MGAKIELTAATQSSADTRVIHPAMHTFMQK
jgi:hypothetical protein